VYFDCLIPFLTFILHYLAYIMHYSWNKQKVSNHTVEVSLTVWALFLIQNCLCSSVRLGRIFRTLFMTLWHSEHGGQALTRRSPCIMECSLFQVCITYFSIPYTWETWKWCVWEGLTWWRSA
jgi:hypothetical protein